MGKNLMECGVVLHKHDCDYYASVHGYYVLLTLLCNIVRYCLGWVFQTFILTSYMRFDPSWEVSIKFRPAAPEIMGQTDAKVQI